MVCFFYEKIRKVYLCIFFKKMLFNNDLYVKNKKKITGRKTVFFVFFSCGYYMIIPWFLHLFKYLEYN